MSMQEYEKQALEVLASIGARIDLKRVGNDSPDWDPDHLHPLYRFTLYSAKGSYTGKFYGSRAEYEAEQRPTYRDRSYTPHCKTGVYDVLACLTKYDPGRFDEFCDEFGYNNDSVSALKTYGAVCNEYRSLAAIFTPEQLDKLAEIC